MARLDAEMLDEIAIDAPGKRGEDLSAVEAAGDRARARVPREGHDRPVRPGRSASTCLSIPEEFGGMGGGARDIYRVSEEMATLDLGIATGVLAIFLGTDPISVGATPSSRPRWLGRVAERRATSSPTA